MRELMMPLKTTTTYAPILQPLVERLHAIDAHPDMFLETAIIAPSLGKDLSHLPSDWQEFYAACDGIRVRWRHRFDSQDQDVFGWDFSPLKKKKKPFDLWSSDDGPSGVIEIPGYDIAFAREGGLTFDYAEFERETNRSRAAVMYALDMMEAVQDSLAGITATLDGEEVDAVEVYNISTPFETVDKYHSFVMRRMDTHQLFWSTDHMAYMEIEDAVDLSVYLQMLAQHAGHVTRRADMFREGFFEIDLDEPHSLLGRHYRHDLRACDPEELWAFINHNPNPDDDAMGEAHHKAVEYFIRQQAQTDFKANFFEFALPHLVPLEPQPRGAAFLLMALCYDADDLTEEHWARLWPHLDAIAQAPVVSFRNPYRYELESVFESRNHDQGLTLLRRAQEAYDEAHS